MANVQYVITHVSHDASVCPADGKDSLAQVISNLEGLADQVANLSDGKVRIVADWYDRNAHAFHYYLELTDIRAALAEDILKRALGLQVTVTSQTTESGEQALEALKRKLELKTAA